MERTLRERNRLRKLEDARKEKRWLNPTEAQLMQSREYLDWFQMQPEQYGDEPPNNTFDLFLTERRRVKEKGRLRLFEEQRKAARQQLRQEREAAQPVRTEPEPAAPKRRGRPIDPRSKRQRDLAAPEPAAPKQRGRPIDPNSKRQRDLAARQQEAEAKAETERKLSQMTPAELEAYHREQLDLEVKRATVLNSEARLRSGSQYTLRYIRSVELPKYVPLERREEVLPSPPSSPPPSTRPPSPPPRSPPPSPPP